MNRVKGFTVGDTSKLTEGFDKPALHVQQVARAIRLYKVELSKKFLSAVGGHNELSSLTGAYTNAQLSDMLYRAKQKLGGRKSGDLVLNAGIAKINAALDA